LGRVETMSLLRINGQVIPPLPPPNILCKGSKWDMRRCRQCGSPMPEHECIEDVRASAIEMLTATFGAEWITAWRVETVVQHYLDPQRVDRVELHEPGKFVIIPQPRSRIDLWLDTFRRARPPFAGPPGPIPDPPPRPRAPEPKDARDGGPFPPLPPRPKDTREGKRPPPRAPEGPPAQEVRKGGGRRFTKPKSSWWAYRE
jgi:hypothetical protein